MGGSDRVTELPLSVVVPCFNEAQSLPVLVERFMAVFGESSFELILVDNGSTDETASILAVNLSGRRFRRVRSVAVEKNIGYGHGIMTGLHEARGTFLAFTHADMQCDPADVMRAFDRARSEPEPEKVFVKGRRSGRPWRDCILTIGMQVLATSALRTLLTDINAQPKLFHRQFLSKLTAPPADFNFDTYILYKARLSGMRIVTIPVRFGPRQHGVSKWAFSLPSRLRHVKSSVAYLLRLGVFGDRADRHGADCPSGRVCSAADADKC